MARLRFAGLSGTLGASLTSGATTITFAAALTYNNGTAVPTLVANEYIPLTIKTSTGGLSEIVWLTAYTTGGTTGTIIRGKEGTTGVSHANGDAFTHSVTPADLCGIHRPDNPYDPLWGPDLGFDWEFEADNSGVVPTGFSWNNQGGASFLQAWGAGIISVPGSSTDSLRSITRSATGLPSTWTIKGKVSDAADNNQFTSVGLMVRNAGGQSMTVQKVGGDNGIGVTLWNSDLSFNSNIVNAVMNHFTALNYFGIRYNSSTSLDFLWSPDGIAWKTLVNIDQSGFLGAITQIGFFASNTSNPQAFNAAFYWFRVR